MNYFPLINDFMGPKMNNTKNLKYCQIDAMMIE